MFTPDTDTQVKLDLYLDTKKIIDFDSCIFCPESPVIKGVSGYKIFKCLFTSHHLIDFLGI
jgi:hypothetical protein